MTTTPFTCTYAFTENEWSNDTGSGGLNETGGAAVVRNWFRKGDTNNRGNNWPKVEVSLVSQSENDKLVASGAGNNTQQVVMVVQFDIVTKGDNRFVEQSAVIKRMRSVFHKKVFSPILTDHEWSMNEMVFVQEGQAPVRDEDNEVRWIIRARIDGRRST